MNNQILEKEKWIKLRNTLNSSYGYSDDWLKAVKLFDQRIQNKYFKPIDTLINMISNQGEGFSIVIIQCALVETFAAFKEGVIYNHHKPEVGGISYEYRDSGELFERFLNTASVFEGIFYSKGKNGDTQYNVPFCAAKFYTQVRCGLMHEARTKGDWLINATKNDDPNDLKFIKRKIKGNIIYRTLFQTVLCKYFESYKSDLLNRVDTSNQLRRMFARKLDHLYDIKDEFEWWKS